jgi:TRAP-type C4-dicarboxylate transport system permease small subunit
VDTRASQSWLTQAGRIVEQAENLILLLLLAGLIALASSQILLRNVFSIGVAWTDGTIRLMVLWLALLAGIAAARERRHIAIDVIVRNLPPALKRATNFLTSAFTVAVMSVLSWYSWSFVAESREFGDVLVDNWPAWIFQLILPVGFALIGLRYLIRAAEQLIARN